LTSSTFSPEEKLWKKTPSEKFMERFWAFKRIKSLFDNPTNEECERTFEFNDYNEYEFNENENLCYEKAISLALKYNFVTEGTSLVVESDKEYFSKKMINFDTTYQPKQTKKYVTTKYGQVKDYDEYYEYSDSSNYASSSYGSSSGGSTSHSSGGYQDSYYYQYDVYDSSADDYETTTTIRTTTTTAKFYPCKLILYSKTHFRGDSLEIENDIDSLVSKNFDKKMASIDVEGTCCWEVFVDQNFSGQSMKFERQGRFPSAVDLRHIFQKASSIKQC
jgi:hypothetical protein